MTKVILAEKAGFCFGVKRAVDLAIESKNKYKQKIYTLGPLIHNKNVVNYLKDNSIFPVELGEIDNLSEKDVVIIRSHGVTPEVINIIAKQGINIVDATCPYVRNIHKKVKKYYELGYKIIIVGDKNHPEVIGINGWCNNEAFITKDGSDIDNLPNKVCVVSQTTEKEENWEKTLNVVKSKCDDMMIFNTICSATDIRQKSAHELSKNCDAMVVLGGKNSSNTTKLYEICRQNCENTIHVENAGEIPDYLINSKKISNIGVTAGASTPDWIIKEAVLKMSNSENLEINEQLKFMEENDVKVFVGKIVKGEVISLNEKEAFINIGYKADAVLPVHEASREDNVNLKEIFELGQVVEAKVINVKNEDGNVVLSTVELEREANFKTLKEAFENKTTVLIKVKEIVKGGILASYKGIRVFIPASHVDLYRVDNLEEYIGKELEILVIEFTKERKNTKIVGSRKELLKKEKEKLEQETWNSLEKGQVTDGIVRRITGFGAFIEINGVDGLLHISEVSWGKINRIEDVLKVGESVKVYILEADKENKKLSLSIKQLSPNPWENIKEKYPVGNIVLGKVVRFTNFGAFVELEPGVDGLIHISQISHTRINKPGDVLKIGESVKAKILDVNAESQKIALSIRELEEI
jgi:4-hydroxy-3-methylbut-2-enyl diphosphate reductase